MDDLTVFWTIIGGNLAVLAVVLTFFFWNRSESNADRRDMMNMINAIHNEIYAEMRDFHGRLCALEEKNRERK